MASQSRLGHMPQHSTSSLCKYSDHVDVWELSASFSDSSDKNEDIYLSQFQPYASEPLNCCSQWKHNEMWRSKDEDV